jgi:hypothetical protein
MICVSVNLLFLILFKFRWFCFHLHLFQGELTIPFVNSKCSTLET